MNAPSPSPTNLGTPASGGGQNTALYVAFGCAGLMLVTLCLAGAGAIAVGMSGGAAVGGGLGGAPGVMLRGQITSYTGSLPLGPGTACELPVEQVTRPDGTVWCHVRMSCGGLALYGSESNGFFPCTITPSSPGVPGRVSGQDPQTTMADRDGAFTVNTDTRSFEAHDDGSGASGFFVVVGTITSVE
jgi:hypothetical protein